MIESEFVTWEAPDEDHPVRRLSQRSYDLRVAQAEGRVAHPVGRGRRHRGPGGAVLLRPRGQGPPWPRRRQRVLGPRDRTGQGGLHFTIRDSFANGNASADIGTFSTVLEDGSLADTDLIAVYRVNDKGEARLDGRALGDGAHARHRAQAGVATLAGCGFETLVSRRALGRPPQRKAGLAPQPPERPTRRPPTRRVDAGPASRPGSGRAARVLSRSACRSRRTCPSAMVV